MLVPRSLLLNVAQMLVLSLFATGSHAQTWSHAYDASLGTLPSLQGFTHQVIDPAPNDGLDESNYSVVGGVLTQGPTGAASNDNGNTQSYQLASEIIDFTRDVIVVDLSLRIIESTLNAPPAAGPRAGFGVRIADRTGALVILYVAATGAFIYGTDTQTSPFVPFDATDTFHDYRFRVSPTGATVELDGSEIASLDRAAFFVGAGPNLFSLGDLTILQRSSSQLEHFRIERYALPVPEVRNYQAVTQTTASDSNSTKTLTVACPAGSAALTGGASTSAGPEIGISGSHPGAGNPPTSWVGSARELVSTGASWSLRVDVVCGEVSGYERLEGAGPQDTDADKSVFLECPGGKVPFSGGAELTGVSLSQAVSASSYDDSLILTPRWLVNAIDFGAATSSASWGIDVQTLCSDATRQEYREDMSALVAGTPKSMVVNCLGGKLPIGGGAYGGDGGLEWSRPKNGAVGEPPVGWDAQARGTGAWRVGVRLECAPLADPTVSADGLLARFRAEFDAYDSWGWTHGTLTNGVGFAPGVEGQAFSFDGTADRWVSIPSQTFNGSNGIDLYPASDFTVGAWIKTSAALVDLAAIVQLYDPGGLAPANWSTWYLMLLEDGRLQGFVRAGAANVSTIVESAEALNDGQWHHVALSRNLGAGSLLLYVDGVQVDAEPLTLGRTDQPLTPGNPGFGDPVAVGAWRLSQSTDLNREFEGEIDDVSYWDRALALDEIQNLVGCHQQIVPRVLNLDADRFTSPIGADHTLCVYLEAGAHELTLVDPVADPEARFRGWSPSPSGQWGTVFSVDPEFGGGFTFGLPVSEASAQDAFDNTLDKQVTLTLGQAQRVYFSLVEHTAFDNRGGVSIRLPEPSGGAGIGAGISLLGLLAQRRRARRDR